MKNISAINKKIFKFLYKIPIKLGYNSINLQNNPKLLSKQF